MQNMDRYLNPNDLDVRRPFMAKSIFHSKHTAVMGLIALSALIVPAVGDAQSCAELFASHSHQDSAPASIDLKARLSFHDVLPPGHVVEKVVSDQSGRYAAIDSVPEGRSVKHVITVVDLLTSQPIFTDHFESVKSIHFMDDTDLLTVSATRLKDGPEHKFYLLEYLESKRTPLLDAAADQLVSVAASVIPLEKTSLNWLPALSSRAHIVPNPKVPHATGAVLPEYLPVSGARSWGVNVEQVISRADLPYTFIVQSGSTSREIRRGYSVMNKGLDIYNSNTRGYIGSLAFNSLVPEEVRVNPVSSLMALRLVDPTGRTGKTTVVLVDSKDPRKILLELPFDRSTYKLPKTPGSRENVILNKIISMQWSPGGRHLLISERQAGSLIIYDTVTKKQETSIVPPQDRWPLAGGVFLNNGHYLLLRIGGQKAGVKSEDSDSLHAVVIAIGKPINLASAPQFTVKTSSMRESNTMSVFDPNSVVSAHSMKNGMAAVIAFRNQMVMIDLKNPVDGQTILVPARKNLKANVSSFTSVRKVSEDLLEVSDRSHGVFDLRLP
jgi:hypothetical protein